MSDNTKDQLLKVLVVDDDPLIVTLLAAILAREGFEVLEATSGEQGLRLARTGSPDVVLLDIMMPEMSGFEVYRRLRVQPETKGIPVIFLTASMKPENMSRSMELGAGGYVTKPFSPLVLVNALKETCRLRGESPIVLRSC